MIRVVLDTNIYVSAFNFGGLPEEVLRLAEAGAFILCISPFMANEIRRVLMQKFTWSSEDLADTLDPTLEFARTVRPRTSVAVVQDPDDNRVLECALEAQAQVIVTGDGDLLRLKRFGDIEIMTPPAFLDTRIRA